jgi:hypothetical protein
LPLHVGFAPKATELSHWMETTLSATMRPTALQQRSAQK